MSNENCIPPVVSHVSVLGKEWHYSGVQVHFGLCYHLVPVFLLTVCPAHLHSLGALLTSLFLLLRFTP